MIGMPLVRIQSSLPGASGQAGKGSPLIRMKYAGSSPAWPTKGADHDEQTGPANTVDGPLAQWQSGGLLTRVSSRVRSPDGPLRAPLVQRTAWRSSKPQTPVRSWRGALMLRWSSGYLARPSTWRLPVRPWHGARSTWPHRLMARILAFQAEGDGSEPSGATARWCNGNMPSP
jgi:hypothetical protein